MSLFDYTQSGLSKLQAVPIIGPVVFSPVKMIWSTAQIIKGLAVGVFFGMPAAALHTLGNDRVAAYLAEIAALEFWTAFKGVGHLFYAAINLASLGIIGGSVELARRDCKLWLAEF